MDILSTETIGVIVSFFKVTFIFFGAILVIVKFFYTKETRKMEKKLQIYLPGSVQLAMAVELSLAILFLFVSTVVFFLF